MPLSTGTRLGAYEIVAAIGTGGMGGLACDVTSAPVQRTVRLIFNLFDELRRLKGR